MRSEVTLMEVCGTHTMAIARLGLRQLLPDGVRLVSGPGCPVCVTPAGALDAVLEFSMTPGVTLATYGDLLRVPGSVRGDTLAKRRAAGADVRVVYSAMDAVELARREPGRQVVFLGVGFETTAPGTAACILAAQADNVQNFSVVPLLKTTRPAIKAILRDPTCRIDGIVCPGHVATIVGADAFSFLPRDYHIPAVVAGFEAEDLLAAFDSLCAMLRQGEAKLVNKYPRAVRPKGNPAAQAAIKTVFTPADTVWRGLGRIERSGLAIRDAYAGFDAARRFGLELGRDCETRSGCRCGEVLRGILAPEHCPLFGAACTPADPVGPCMVSSEGACAAAYKYRSL